MGLEGLASHRTVRSLPRLVPIWNAQKRPTQLKMCQQRGSQGTGAKVAS